MEKHIKDGSLPTAEQFLIEAGFPGHAKHGLAKKWMIEFAKLHVEAALKEANEKVVLTDEVCEVLQEHWFEEYIDKNSILNSYSLDKIK